MAAYCRLLVIRASLALLAAVLLVAGGTAGAQAASPRLTITAHFGYQDTIKVSDWMPLTIDLTNNGASLEGVVEVESSGMFGGKGGPPSGSAIYQIPISLATASKKQLRVYVMEDQPSPIPIRVLEGGRVIATQSAVAPNTTAVLMGVVSDQPSTLGGLASINPGGITAGVTRLTAADVPESGVLLRPFDVLAIDDFATDTLTAGQRSAIEDYVINGGALLLGTGGSWHKTLGGLPTALLPIQVTGSQILPASSALGGISGVEVASGSLAGGTPWLSDGSRPLLVEKPVGQGWVEMATFDWNQDSIVGWTGTDALLRQAVVRGSFGINASQAAGPSLSQRGGTFSQVLSNLPSLDLPGWWLIGSLVLFYVLLVGPINYLVLRAINRRALAWITVPTIAVVAAGGAYGAGTLMKGTSVQANEVSIIHVAPDWDHAYMEAYTGILVPTRGDYEVGVGGPRLVSSLANFNGSFDPTHSLVRVNTADGTIMLPAMTAFTLRGFATEAITLAPHLVATAHLVGGKLTGQVQNLSSSSFTDGVVLAGGGFQTFGRLAPGQSFTFSVTPSVSNPFNGPPAYMQIYQGTGAYGAPPGSGSAESLRMGDTKAAVLSTLPVNGFKGISLSATPIIVGWTDEPFQEVTVDGSHPRASALTGVVLTVPVDQIAAGKLPAGVVTGRLTDIDGSAQPGGGPPGTVLMNSGSTVYDFMPSLGAGLHLVSATVEATNPFASKGPVVGPNGTAGTVRGQAWDWSLSRWMDLNYQDGGSTNLPDGAVNPVNGEVRLKLSSDGAYTTGWLSLAGVVQ